MNIFDFETVDSLPVLYHPGLDLLVISDLHLGLEGSLTSKGSYVPKFQLESLEQDLEKAFEETSASRILINGDLKQEFSTTEYSEREEINALLDFLDGRVDEIIVTRGNHDTFVTQLVEDYGIELEDYHLEDGILFVHGDDPLQVARDYETLVIGHEHPALVLEDEVGVKEKLDCFLYGETGNGRRIIVMPAFSSISRGSKVNRVPEDQLLSPILKNQVDVGTLKAVGVDRDAGLFEFPEIGRI